MAVLHLELTYSEAKLVVSPHRPWQPSSLPHRHLPCLQKQPRFDLVLSNNGAHLRTCADSSSLLIQLVEHLVAFGDLPREAAVDAAAAAVRSSAAPAGSGPDGAEDEPSSPAGEPEVQATELEEINSQIEDALREEPSRPPVRSRTPSSEEDFVLVDLPGDLMDQPAAQARKEVRSRLRDEPRQPLRTPAVLSWVQELEELNRQGAVIRSDAGGSLRFKNDHFDPSGSLESDTDPLADPTGFPCAVERYTVREVCFVWHLYGGSDFNTAGSARALAAAGVTTPSLSEY